MSNLVRHAPRFTENQAAAMAKELFNITASADLLPSERDQNFRLQDQKGGQFVLKIANAAETREALAFQNLAMTHVAEKGAALFDEFDPCPRVCSAPGSEDILSISGQDGASHFVRLLTYLPGKPLATVNPHDKDLLFSLGSFLGRIDRVFMDFDHPATRRVFHWDLARCGEVVASLLDEIDDAEKRGLVNHRLDRYRTDTAPRLAGLRTSVIHSDGNATMCWRRPMDAGATGSPGSSILETWCILTRSTNWPLPAHMPSWARRTPCPPPSRWSPVIDLSVGTPLLGAGPQKDDKAAMTRIIFREMEDADSRLGIGRYDEARLIYTADAFKVETDTDFEYRTVHLGLDLFARPGEAVYAFMAGRVHSFRNNTAHQDYGPTIILSHEADSGILFYSLYGHLSATALDGLEAGMPVGAGQTIGTIGTSAENGGWAPHLHFQLITDLMGMEGDFPGVVRPSQRRVWTALCPDPGVVLGLTTPPPAAEVRRADEIMAIRRRHLGKSLSVSYDTPLKIVRGMGGFLYTETGQPYMDGVNNVCHVGHCHPAVVTAGRRQMAVLNTNTRYLHDNIVDYARRLLATFPEPLSVCFFVCSGSEANELALRLARAYTGQDDIITVDGAYHGNTQGLVDISPYKHDGPGGKGAPDWVQTVVMPCGYRGPHKGTGSESGIAYAGYVKTAIDRIEVAGRRPAAFICESMLGCGGQVLLPDGYLQAAFDHVRAAGGVCIADEVQVGFGRAGTHFWAFETQGVVPDIVSLGKPMGNGHPLAAVVTTPEIANAFNNGMEYFNTYGGNPVSCAVGMAVLDVIQSEGLQENARTVGAYLLERLSTLKEKSWLVGDVRGLGLYLGVELVMDHGTLAPAADHAAYICNRMKDYGFLISTDGPLHNVLKLKPPIIFSKANADALVDALEKVFAEDCLQK